MSGSRDHHNGLRPDVLIVDDDEDVRLSFAAVLQGAGYTVATAEDVDKGLELLRQRGAGVVLLDLRMPGRNGLELLDAFSTPFPVIVVSGQPFLESEVDQARTRVVMRLQKPVDPRRLIQMVGSHLRQDSPSTAAGHKRHARYERSRQNDPRFDSI